MKHLFFFIGSLFIASAALGQAEIVLSEFSLETNTVELQNIGDEALNVSSYRLCTFPQYATLSSLTLESGAYMMQPGDYLVVSGYDFDGFEDDGELGVYVDSNWGSSQSIRDYVEWGFHGHQRSSVAEGADIWANNDFANVPMAGMSLVWDGAGDAGSNWSSAASSFGSANFGGDLAGGTISTDAELTICTQDGTPDPITFELTENVGANSQWVVTDDNNLILGLPASNVIDLEDAPAGVCLVWHMSYADGLTGLEVDNFVSDLVGQFSLSNSVAITRQVAEGGELTGGPFEFNSVGDGEPDMLAAGSITLSGNQGENTQWIVTDDEGYNLGLPPMPGAVDFDGAGPGTCLVWHLSY
ncbi:MAG: hypothetical protein HRT74_03680, partial [Flavobacteriales bacterium]|nr:hypothetical protein [Flavobacteriales bacterium]